MSQSSAPLPLTHVLADCSRAGVRPLPPGSASRVAAAAADAGFSCARIDLAHCEDKASLLRHFATQLHFPAWFGHNWDALTDCLCDLSWHPMPGHVVLLEHAGPFRAHAGNDFETLLEILRDASAHWATEQVPFWTFVDLSGAAD